MKQLKQLIVCLTTSFILFGCFPWSKTFKEKEVVARYGFDDNGIASFINIGGYYLSNDTTMDGIAFYKDGTVKKIDAIHWSDWLPISDGVYKITNDTIYADTFYFLGMNGGMQLTHLKFKVIDMNSIKLFEWADNDEWIHHKESHKLDVLFRFVPSENLPLPSTHMKQKKWMWIDKNKWREYMQKNVRVKYWQ